MLNGFTNVTITKDLTSDIVNSLKDLAKKTVCVGIPDATEHQNSKLSDAQILYLNTNGVRDTSMINEMQHNLNSGMPYSQAHELYIHSNGSPLWNVPPRPVLEPAIENSKEEIAESMKNVVNVALDGGNITPALGEVGMQGQNIAREWFTNPSNNWAHLSPATIEARARRKYKISKYKRQSTKEKYRVKLNEYIETGDFKPLIDTEELRKSITYTIEDGDI